MQNAPALCQRIGSQAGVPRNEDETSGAKILVKRILSYDHYFPSKNPHKAEVLPI
jgi:hypothetical protein